MEIKTPEGGEVAPVVPVTPPAEAAAPAPEATPAAPAPAKEPTAAEIMTPAIPAAKPAADNVPLATFLEVKKEAKEVPGLRTRIAELEAQVKAGVTAPQLSDEIAALGKEFDVDPTFLGKLSAAISSQARTEAQAAAGEAVKPLTEKQRNDAIDTAFKTHFDAAMETMPEMKEIVNPEVIKSLSLDPKNAEKTFAQIIEDTYGSLVPGKRTIETTTPGGGKEPETIDFDKAAKDPTYFSEIMANPTLKAKYNAELPKRLKL